MASETGLCGKGEIIFLANPNSPHVRHWESILKHANRAVSVISAHGAESIVSSPVYDFIPACFKRLPLTIRYVMLGFYIRLFFNKSDISFVHAHNTSGYGLSAFISGLPYIVTTYGSEIFNADARGAIYRYMLRVILRRARLITSTSSKMTETLVCSFGVPESKICQFSLGVSDVFYCDEGARLKFRGLFLGGGPIWIANRRIHPHYHTIELVDAFIKFRRVFNRGVLILLEGDSHVEYLEEVKSRCDGCDYIRLINGFISQDELRGYLSAADFSISVPESDQLSSSILESAICGAVPLLSNLDSYMQVRSFCILFDILHKNDPDSYIDIFSSSYKLYLSNGYSSFRDNMIFCVKKFTVGAVLPEVERLYKFE